MTYDDGIHYSEVSMAGDPEIEAMTVVANALAPLDEDARGRVLEWAAKRHGVSITAGSSGGRRKGANSGSGAGDDPDEVDGLLPFEDFTDLYDTANPQSEADRTLVAGYWFQVVQDEGGFKGYAANEALRNMGHEVSNITRACNGLKARQPALVRQMAKSGKSKQARKTYKLTNAGIKAVEDMLK